MLIHGEGQACEVQVPYEPDRGTEPEANPEPEPEMEIEPELESDPKPEPELNSKPGSGLRSPTARLQPERIGGTGD